jgi:hypothetical protein
MRKQHGRPSSHSYSGIGKASEQPTAESGNVEFGRKERIHIPDQTEQWLS